MKFHTNIRFPESTQYKYPPEAAKLATSRLVARRGGENVEEEKVQIEKRIREIK